MFIIHIGRGVIETRIRNLIAKRDLALANEDYDKVWMLNQQIDKNVCRLFSWSCYEI